MPAWLVTVLALLALGICVTLALAWLTSRSG
jgi:hypothetical protein